jgi:tetratricopeptide (TPR) repeat protein
MGDRYSIGYATGNLGYVHEKLGDDQRALECFQKKLEIADEMGYKQGKSIALNDLGNAFSRLGDIEKAETCLDEAIAIGRELKLMDYLCGYLQRKSEIILSAQDSVPSDRLSVAAELNNEASEIAKRVGKQDIIFATELLSARIIAARGRITDSVERLSALAEQYLDHKKQAAIYYTLAGITLKPDHRATAHDLYRDLYKRMPDHEFKRRAEEMKPT